MKELVSIGLPVVKYDFFEKALMSCLNQTYNKIEIIIVNNSRNNNTKKEIRAIVNNYLHDRRINYYENDIHLDMVNNWNKTLSYAKGKYFAILCDDDYWAPQFIEEMISLSRKYSEVNLFHSRVAIIDSNSIVKKLTPNCPEYEDDLDFIYNRVSRKRIIYLSDFMVNRESISKLGGYKELPDGWGSDDITWYHLALLGGVAYSSQVLYFYRDSVINVSNSARINNKLKAIQLQYEFIKVLLLKVKKNKPYDQVKYEMITDEMEQKYVNNKKGNLIFLYLRRRLKLPYSLSLIFTSIYRFYLLARTKSIK